MYTFNTITSPEDILTIKDAWIELHKNSIYSSFYNSFEFIYNSLKYFSDKDAQPFVVCISLKEKLIGIYFLQESFERRFLINLRLIEFTALDEIDKPYPVIDKDFHNTAWSGLFQYLLKEKKWDILRLIEQTPKNISTIINTLDKGLLYRLNPDKSGPLISLDQSWDEFKASHKKLRKKINILSRDYNGKYTIKIKHGSELLSEYKKVESNSWKIGKQGIQRSQLTLKFYNSLIKQLDPDNVILAILYADSTPIAAELAYIHSDTLYLAQGCYNQKYSKYSPGMISTALLLKKFMEETSLKKADCLCGYAQYLEAWSNEIIQTKILDIYKLTPRSLYFFTTRLFSKLVRLNR